MSENELPDDPFNPVDEPTAEDPATSGPIGKGDVMSRLFDGAAPGPGVQELQADYGLGREWSIALRGLVRSATGDGIPPVAEILMGSVLGVFKLQRGSNAGSDGQDETTNGPVDPTQEGDNGLPEP